MKPAIELDNAKVFHGSNLEVLPYLEDNSIDAIVTDPPYELGFMGKSWDSSGIAYSVELWTECMRVLKPGGHLLAFGGSRTWHRLAVAIEDAGFEMRDSIAWLYGSGFPKSMDISKQIDKAAGAEREVIGKSNRHGGGIMDGHSFQVSPIIPDITAPATAEAKQWQGWGTALKPAFEPIVVARKPLEEKTVAANVLKYGTGGLNIDGSRIATDEVITNHSRSAEAAVSKGKFGDSVAQETHQTDGQKLGRWPANIILDPYTAELLDEQSGISKSVSAMMPVPDIRSGKYGSDYGNREFDSVRGFNDSGGASRFFYVAKASKKDRNEGLDDLEAQQSVGGGGGVGDYLDNVNSASGKFGSEKAPAKNFHPTVKPTSLMEYLIKLVTPPNGTVLDPFTGSGSTGKAALLNGFKFIGIELTEEYLPIIEGRMKWATQQASQQEQKKDEVLF